MPGQSRLQWTQGRAEALREAAAAPAPASRVLPVEKPTLAMAKRLLDPRDAEIARLRGALEGARLGCSELQGEVAGRGRVGMHLLRL